MVRAEPPAERDAHLRCRNLVRERSPDTGEIVPGRHCANRLGVVHVLDCPVYQGLSCCLFDERPEGEAPEPQSEEELEAIADRLSLDYLRWTYWKRVEALRQPEPPPVPVVEEPIQEERVVPPPTEESPEAGTGSAAAPEKYPGQRRSEDARRSKSARPQEESPPQAEPPDAPDQPETKSDGTTPGTGEQKPSGSKRRRSHRRRRRRKKRSSGSAGSPPAGS